MHSRKKEAALKSRGGHPRAVAAGTRGVWAADVRIWWTLGALGFTALYREGFEVVLFLQSYRLRVGNTPVEYGVLAGAALTVVAGILTFVAHHRLPYRRMLVLTGVLLGLVLLVMVGEEAQEMQLAHWLPATTIPALARVIPPWIGTWFSVFPTVETLAAQGVAALLVLASFAIARPRTGAPSNPVSDVA